MVIINRQDRNGVRTAPDLERKYNLGQLVKAVKVHEEAINKTDSTLEDFIYATVGSLTSLDGLIDGNITTYYYSGVPTIENYPAKGWNQEEYADHVDDLYYDKDTGYAYSFSLLEDGTYGWERTKASYIIKALAMANSAADTADSKRRIFTDTPFTPYENGDMWVNKGELYICQISKTEEESYDEKDFIIATKYTDDTYAKQVGEALEVLRGTVLTVKEGVDEYKVKVDDLDKNVSAEMQLLKNSFKILVTDESGNSLMTETENGWQYVQKTPEKGEDGKTSYLHIKYSDDGTTFTANDGETVGAWIGTLVDFNESDSMVFSDYTWKKFTDDVDAELEQIHEMVSEQGVSITASYEEAIKSALESYIETGDFNGFKESWETQLRLIKEDLEKKYEDTKSSIDSVNDDLQYKFNTITKYFSFDANGLTIGQVDNPYKVIIDNDRYSMTVNGVEVLWIDAITGEVHTPGLTVTNSFHLLGYLIDMDGEGNVNCEYVGGEE